MPKKNAPKKAVHCLLLTCMDYRLTDEVVEHMEMIGRQDDYDHVVLAGASLGLFMPKHPEWAKTFWDHVAIAVELHEIDMVVFMDHRDCGAYRLHYGEDLTDDPGKERALHLENLKKAAKLALEKFPKLKVGIRLMNLDGSVEVFPMNL